MFYLTNYYTLKNFYDREYIRYYQGNTNNNLMIKYTKYRLLFQRIYEGDIAEK